VDPGTENLVCHLTESTLLALSLALALATNPIQAACPCPPAALMREVELAYRDYTAFELDAFTVRIRELRPQLECLDTPITAPMARQLHLVLGLQAWLDQDPRLMAAAARGVYAVDPSFQPGPDIAPEGSRVRAVFTTARQAGPGGQLALEGVILTVDGLDSSGVLPAERAALVQWRDHGGGARSHYLDGLGVPEVLVAELRLLAPDAPRTRHRSRWLLVGGGAAAVAGSASVWGAHRVELAYHASYDPAQEPRLYAANQVLGYNGWALLGGAGVAATGALWLWEF